MGDMLTKTTEKDKKVRTIRNAVYSVVEECMLTVISKDQCVVVYLATLLISEPKEVRGSV